MAISHKKGATRLEATTTIDDATIARLVKESAEAATQPVLGSTVRIEKAQPGMVEISVLGPGKLVEQMVFQVLLAPGNGSTTIKTNIIRAITLQSKMYGFIPTGPKKIAGFRAYRKFLDNLHAKLMEADPNANCSVIEATA